MPILKTVFQLLLQLALDPLTVNESGRFLYGIFQQKRMFRLLVFDNVQSKRMMKLPSPTLSYVIVSHCFSLEILQINIHLILQINIHCEAFR